MPGGSDILIGLAIALILYLIQQIAQVPLFQTTKVRVPIAILGAVLIGTLIFRSDSPSDPFVQQREGMFREVNGFTTVVDSLLARLVRESWDSVPSQERRGQIDQPHGAMALVLTPAERDDLLRRSFAMQASAQRHCGPRVNRLLEGLTHVLANCFVMVHELSLPSSGNASGRLLLGMPIEFADRLRQILDSLPMSFFMETVTRRTENDKSQTSVITIDVHELKYGLDISPDQSLTSLRELSGNDSLLIYIVPISAHWLGRWPTSPDMTESFWLRIACKFGVASFPSATQLTSEGEGRYRGVVPLKLGSPILAVALPANATIGDGYLIRDDGVWKADSADATATLWGGWTFTPPGAELKHGEMWYALR